MARLSGLLFHSAVAQERMAAALRRLTAHDPRTTEPAEYDFQA